MLKPDRRRAVAILGTRGFPSYYGGFETAVRKLVPYFSQAGLSVLVYGREPLRPRELGAALRSGTQGGPAAGAGPARDPSVRRVNTRGISTPALSTLTFGFTSALHAARLRIPVALIMNVANGFWLPMLKAAGVRTIVNVDGIEWERAKWSVPAKLMFRLGAQLTARFADDLVFDSEAIATRWLKMFGSRGTFIPYGGDAAEPDLLQHLPVGLQPHSYVLVVARFVPENSIGYFLRVARRLPPSVSVVIVGSSSGGSLHRDVEALITERPNTMWLGHIYDDRLLHALWAHAGAYFHGHTVGGTNPALVQAMALRAPIVAVDTTFNREVLGDAGLLVSLDDEGMAADAITSLLEDHSMRLRLGNAAGERASQHYRWSVVCAKYLALVNKHLD